MIYHFWVLFFKVCKDYFIRGLNKLESRFLKVPVVKCFRNSLILKYHVLNI